MMRNDLPLARVLKYAARAYEDLAEFAARTMADKRFITQAIADSRQAIADTREFLTKLEDSKVDRR